jgi:histidinol-phosphatase (PHP family)
MDRICVRAIQIGVPAVAFTEHLDLETAWRVEDGDIGAHGQKYVTADGTVTLPRFDVEGYLDAISRMRWSYPELRILTGVEFGQPHLWDAEAAPLLSRGIDRVNGSLHMLPWKGEDRTEPTTLYRHRPASDVMWAYLEEIPRMLAGSDSFTVFTHIDYAVRSWPTVTAGPFDPRTFEEGFRSAMRAVADSGRALELNTRNLQPWIPQWWSEEGGRAVSFGSDAHGAETLAANFPEAMDMAEQFGFREGANPVDFWLR